ncbi:putative phosphohydrolase [Bacillus sp. TS-2]|nr:putative phosphohydrolase [Bacillus sp. TS-2]
MLVEEEIFIENLPEELDGFRIVQVTDLHEKEFGKQQAKLIKKIEQTPYDVIVFTGDMLDGRNSTNYTPFYELIDGISQKEHALFVPGNADPPSYVVSEDQTLQKSPFIIGMEERGVTFLESLYSIEKNGTTLHFVDFEISTINDRELEQSSSLNMSAQSALVQSHHLQLSKELHSIDESNSLIIALNHYPVVDEYIDYLSSDSSRVLRAYDFIMAGHYHGGQIRLPFIGALFVPEPWYPNNGLLPPQNRVKGLWEYNGIQQYVSTGLGSSSFIPFLKFRFLNTPELNLITLKRK